jgi:uncharacterized membrane protein YwaF
VGLGVVLMGIAYPVNKLTGANYFFVNWPERGTILETFGSVLGRSMHLPVLMVVAAAVMATMFALYSAVTALTRRSSKQGLLTDLAPAEAWPVANGGTLSQALIDQRDEEQR